MCGFVYVKEAGKGEDNSTHNSPWGIQQQKETIIKPVQWLFPIKFVGRGCLLFMLLSISRWPAPYLPPICPLSGQNHREWSTVISCLLPIYEIGAQIWVVLVNPKAAVETDTSVGKYCGGIIINSKNSSDCARKGVRFSTRGKETLHSFTWANRLT